MTSPRYWAIVLLLAFAAVLLYRRGDKDRVPASAPLADFPSQVGSWTGSDVAIDPGVLEAMGKGTFLNRLYSPAQAQADGPIALFIGYFPTQRTGQSIHSPQHCLPGSGWTFESSSTTVFTDTQGQPHQVGDYIITDGTSRDEVFYWYQSHGRSIASDYQAKFYMLADSIRYNRSDAALVRVVTPLQAGETTQQAHLRLATFARQLPPLLPTFIPN